MYKLNTVLVILFFLCACNDRKDNEKRRLAIGDKLMKLDSLHPETRVIPDVVIVGDGLVQKVSLIKTHTSSYRLKVREGDLKGESNADHILSIYTNYQNIAIRLKYNKQKDKYDILGWATVYE